MSYPSDREKAKSDCAAATPPPPGWDSTSPIHAGGSDGGGMGPKNDLTPQHWKLNNSKKTGGMSS